MTHTNKQINKQIKILNKVNFKNNLNNNFINKNKYIYLQNNFYKKTSNVRFKFYKTKRN